MSGPCNDCGSGPCYHPDGCTEREDSIPLADLHPDIRRVLADYNPRVPDDEPRGSSLLTADAMLVEDPDAWGAVVEGRAPVEVPVDRGGMH